METQSGFVNVNGGRLYCEAAGAGSPVIFVHGFSLNTSMWDDQFEVFAKSHRVIRFDMRGFGKSPASLEPYRRIDDLNAVLQFFGLERTHLVGLSLGGGDAIDYVLEFPQKVISLTVIDSTLSGFHWTTDWDVQARELGLEGARERWLSHPMFEAALRNPSVAPRLRQMVADYSGWHWLNHDPELGPAQRAAKRLGEIKTPTLVLVGELDIPDFCAIADSLHRAVQGSRKIVLPGIGHLANMEAPEAVNEAILNFLKEVEN